MHEKLLRMWDVINGIENCERKKCYFLTKDIEQEFSYAPTKEEDEFEPTTFEEV